MPASIGWARRAYRACPVGPKTQAGLTCGPGLESSCGFPLACGRGVLSQLRIGPQPSAHDLGVHSSARPPLGIVFVVTHSSSSSPMWKLWRTEVFPAGIGNHKPVIPVEKRELHGEYLRMDARAWSFGAQNHKVVRRMSTVVPSSIHTLGQLFHRAEQRGRRVGARVSMGVVRGRPRSPWRP